MLFVSVCLTFKMPARVRFSKRSGCTHCPVFQLFVYIAGELILFFLMVDNPLVLTSAVSEFGAGL
jgi:hypothetical protein